MAAAVAPLGDKDSQEDGQRYNPLDMGFGVRPLNCEETLPEEPLCENAAAELVDMLEADRLEAAAAAAADAARAAVPAGTDGGSAAQVAVAEPAGDTSSAQPASPLGAAASAEASPSATGGGGASAGGQVVSWLAAELADKTRMGQDELLDYCIDQEARWRRLGGG
jgi:cell division septation protein DedD